MIDNRNYIILINKVIFSFKWNILVEICCNCELGYIWFEYKQIDTKIWRKKIWPEIDQNTISLSNMLIFTFTLLLLH